MKISETNELEKIFTIINDYLTNDNKKIVRYLPVKELRQKIDLTITSEGANFDSIIDFISVFLTYNVKTDHSQFFNQLYGGNNFPAFVGEIISALTNTSIYTYEVAPISSLIEKELVEKMSNFVGFNNDEGTFTTGGSNSNLIAMLSARNKKMPEIKFTGFNNSLKLKAYISSQAHYSHEIAANLLGIGKDNLVKISADKNGKMNTDLLQKQIIIDKNNGDIPFYVVATAGTTLLTAFDPFVEIAEIAKKNKLWFHIDGAFGGSLLLSSKHKHLLSGSELADSFSWNPHKLMNIPLICSVLLLNGQNKLVNNLTELDNDYLYHDQGDACDIGKKSLQCGRKVDVLKLFFAWKFHGDKGYENRINKLFDIAEYVEKRVNDADLLELQAARQSLSVCFRYKPDKKIDLNYFNIKLREILRVSGKSMVNYGFIGNNVTIRFVNVNPDVSVDDIDVFFKNLFEEAEKLLINETLIEGFYG